MSVALPSSPRKQVWAFVDETGDRGTGPKSSRFFAMAAVLIAEEDYPSLSEAIIAAKQTLGVPAQIPLHWKEHVKVFPRRQFVTGLLQPLNLKVNYVIFEKESIPLGAGIRSDPVSFYNYAAGITMERLLLAAGNWPGGARDLKVDFGHVRGFDHSQTSSYFVLKKAMNQGPANWNFLAATPKFLSMSINSGLQAADQYAGMLSAALNPDKFGGYEHQHLFAVRGQIRRSGIGVALNYGFKALTLPTTMTDYPWWPVNGI